MRLNFTHRNFSMNGVQMKIESTQVGTKLVVNLTNLENQKSIIETLNTCADGQCACSSDEYKKVENMDVEVDRNSIQINIAVKPGEVIDPNCISDCLTPEFESSSSTCCAIESSCC